tara:strand:- start:289 stop:543 length:255 start_codon:yes stop_codon:yes gene_type:complete
MTSNWVKDCGVDVGGCDMCLLLDVANERLTMEVAQGDALAVELARERAKYRNEARHWKNVAALALVALACLFAVLVVLGVEKVL